MRRKTPGWIVDAVLGGTAGGLAAAVVAVNLVIYVGIDGGYEASTADVYRQNTVAGLLTAGILVAGPVLGIVVACVRSERGREEFVSEQLDSELVFS